MVSRNLGEIISLLYDILESHCFKSASGLPSSLRTRTEGMRKLKSAYTIFDIGIDYLELIELKSQQEQGYVYIESCGSDPNSMAQGTSGEIVSP
jgi:hypothetical protein